MLRTYLALAAISAGTAALAQATSPLLAEPAVEPAAEAALPNQVSLPSTPPPPPAAPQIIALEVIPYGGP